MATLTDNAVSKFKEFIEHKGTAGDGVRIFLMAGG